MRIEQSCGKDVQIPDSNAELEARIAALETKNKILEDNLVLLQQLNIENQALIVRLYKEFGIKLETHKNPTSPT